MTSLFSAGVYLLLANPYPPGGLNVQTRQAFAIEPGTLTHVIREWFIQERAHLNVSIWFEENPPVNGVHCFCYPSQALRMILAGTPFDVEVVNPWTLNIVDHPITCRPELAEMAPLPPCLRPLERLKGPDEI